MGSRPVLLYVGSSCRTKQVDGKAAKGPLFIRARSLFGRLELSIFALDSTLQNSASL